MLSVKLAFLLMPVIILYSIRTLCFKLAAWTVYLADSFYYLLWEFDRQVLLWVEEHGGADAILAVGTVEHIHVDATLATTPE